MNAQEAINALFEGKTVSNKSATTQKIIDVEGNKMVMTNYKNLHKIDVSVSIHFYIDQEYEIVE